MNRCNRNSLVLSTISALEYNFHKFLFPFSRYFSHLIAVCDFSYAFHASLPEYKNKITRLYNFFPNLHEILPNFKMGQYFLFYGRLSNEKGIMTLLKAWRKVNKNTKLKIAGDGPQKGDILSFIDENNLHNVEYLGFEQKKELFEIITNASFIVVPSECNENNPLAIVEAYAYGKPVIGTNVGGIPEIVIEKKTGYLFNKADHGHLAAVIDKAALISKETYIELSKNARSFALEHFSEETHYNGLMNIYKNLI